MLIGHFIKSIKDNSTAKSPDSRSWRRVILHVAKGMHEKFPHLSQAECFRLAKARHLENLTNIKQEREKDLKGNKDEAEKFSTGTKI